MKVTEQQFPHAFSKIFGQEGIEQWVDAGVEVRDEKSEGSQQGTKVTGTLVAAGPVLPHLTCVEGEIAHCEGEDDDD